MIETTTPFFIPGQLDLIFRCWRPHIESALPFLVIFKLTSLELARAILQHHMYNSWETTHLTH